MGECKANVCCLTTQCAQSQAWPKACVALCCTLLPSYLDYRSVLFALSGVHCFPDAAACPQHHMPNTHTQAPEVLVSGKLTPAADIYALGVMSKCCLSPLQLHVVMGSEAYKWCAWQGTGHATTLGSLESTGNPAALQP